MTFVKLDDVLSSVILFAVQLLEPHSWFGNSRASHSTQHWYSISLTLNQGIPINTMESSSVTTCCLVWASMIAEGELDLLFINCSQLSVKMSFITSLISVWSKIRYTIPLGNRYFNSFTTGLLTHCCISLLNCYGRLNRFWIYIFLNNIRQSNQSLHYTSHCNYLNFIIVLQLKKIEM